MTAPLLHSSDDFDPMSFSRILFLCSCALLLGTQAFAAPVAPDAKAAFAQIAACLRSRDTAQCRNYITEPSKPIYDRFVSYGLVDCLPPDTAYVSQQSAGAYVIIRASVTSNEQPRTMRLAFMKEAGGWKLDIPESLHRGMGDNWQKQLNMTEQLYLMMRTQMGDQLNCSAIQALANTKK